MTLSSIRTLVRTPVIALLLLSLIALPLVGCADDDGPMEEMGEEIDDAVDEVGDEAEDIGDEIEDGVDDATDGGEA